MVVKEGKDGSACSHREPALPDTRIYDNYTSDGEVLQSLDLRARHAFEAGMVPRLRFRSNGLLPQARNDAQRTGQRYE